MKTAPVRPARIAFDDPPRSLEHGDVYHPAIGAAEQARHVFLAGNGLPQRWRGRRSFTILETGFGLGNNFLTTWAAWRDDPARSERLVYASIEAHPPTRDDLERLHARSERPELARALLAAWPPAVPGMHLLPLDDGRVQLQLLLGDVRPMLAAWRGEHDACFLDGHAPRMNPQMWDRHVIEAIGRRAAPGATAATWCATSELRASLAAAGYDAERRTGIGGKRHMTVARHAPRHRARKAALDVPAVPVRSMIVVGAGLAGAWVARALARRGVEVTVLDGAEAPASGASGNPAGLFHPTVHADDGAHARLHRAAALLAHRELAPWIRQGIVPGGAAGLLRLEPGTSAAALRALAARLGLPPDYARVLDADDAAALARVPLMHPAWWFAAAGWVDPGAVVRRCLGEPGIRCASGTAVRAIAPHDAERRWRACDADGRMLAIADGIVLACGGDAARLAAPHGLVDWPIEPVRGQVSWWQEPGVPLPLLPVVGDGYAIGDGRIGLLCGATSQPGDAAAGVREADHAVNRQRLARLIGAAPAVMQPWHGRAGWRLRTPDRLPIVGAVAALPPEGAGGRRDQVRFLPRVPGLHVITALGSRGIALGALAGEVVAAQACGTPWPLEADLADAIDPARWHVRAARRAQSV